MTAALVIGVNCPLQPDERLLLSAGWEIVNADNDPHALRKGRPPTYRFYVPPGYEQLPGFGRRQSNPIAWSLADAVRRVRTE